MMKTIVIAAEYEVSTRTLWLIKPDGTRIGVVASDDDYNREQSVNDWFDNWSFEIERRQ